MEKRFDRRTGLRTEEVICPGSSRSYMDVEDPWGDDSKLIVLAPVLVMGE